MPRRGARAADRPDLANHWSASDDPGCIRIVVSELRTVESSDFRRAQIRVHPCSFSGADERRMLVPWHASTVRDVPMTTKGGARAAQQWTGVHRGPDPHPVPMPPHVQHAVSMLRAAPLHSSTDCGVLLGSAAASIWSSLGSRHLRPLHSPAGRDFRSRARPAACGLPVCPSSDFRVSSSQAQRSMVTLCPLRRRRCWRAAAIATAKRRRRQATRAAAAPVPAAFRPWLWRR
jgi:hypothetical protein